MTDGLLLVMGSGLSSAEGLPGMPELALHLINASSSLDSAFNTIWAPIQKELEGGAGLEAALHTHPPPVELEDWIVSKTTEFLLPTERDVISSVLSGSRTLRLSKLLNHYLPPTAGLPILTSNYDRLVEVACELAGYHVDTTAIGVYAGDFDHNRSCLGSCKKLKYRGKTPILDHYPRAVVLKPHGSFDWYKSEKGPRRCSVDLDAPRLIITPGLNKYRAGYEIPFDKHRELANSHIQKASRLLIVGYGFNDDHLQVHLMQRLRDGTPCLILNRSLNDTVRTLAKECPNCTALSRPTNWDGVAVLTNDTQFEHQGANAWDLGVMVEEFLQ